MALEKSHREFEDIGKELERMSIFHELENSHIIMAKNRALQDKYVEIKTHLLRLIQNERSIACLKAPFSYTSHQSWIKPSDSQITPNQFRNLDLKSPHEILVNTPEHTFKPTEPSPKVVRPGRMH